MEEEKERERDEEFEEKIINMFNDLISGQRKDICFSRGYKIFEECYEAFKEDFDLDRKEEGYMSIITFNR